VPDAWHHCLALLDVGEGAAQVFCNGQAGSSVPVASDFAVTGVTSAATLGGGARTCWAELARFQATTWRCGPAAPTST
jgi:hypothetical protein